MEELIFLEPIFKQRIWGGSRLKYEFSYDIAENDIGECWAISGHENGDCKVASGIYKGKYLSELWNEKRELFGNVQGDVFPLLVKIIDAKTDLSIQVHPNDEYAKVNEHGAMGKTECWYILDCDEDTTIIIGHNAKNIEEVKEMIYAKKWNEFVREIPIKKGDFFQITPGCVHAIKGGTLLIETQQSSDITYRVYDYDRLSNGVKRELHIEKSIDVIKAPFVDEKGVNEINEYENCTEVILEKCEYYQLRKYDIKGEYELKMNAPFLNVTVIEGEGYVENHSIKKGDSFIVPYNHNLVKFNGNMSLMVSNV